MILYTIIALHVYIFFFNNHESNRLIIFNTFVFMFISIIVVKIYIYRPIISRMLRYSNPLINWRLYDKSSGYRGLKINYT